MIRAFLALAVVGWASPTTSAIAWWAEPTLQIRPEQHSSGSLVIVGGGRISPEIKQRFFELAGGKSKARIVVVPTASADADKPAEQESFLKQWKELFPDSIAWLHTRDRKTADDAEFSKPIREATAVWFSGGDQNRIIAAYRGTLVEKELHKLYERGGVLGGTSAGAAVMSDVMIQGGQGDQVKVGPGFGFLKSVVVDQHFTNRKREPRLRHVLSKHPNHAGLGIDERTAIVVQGETVTVVGAETVTAMWPKQSKNANAEKTLKNGERFDLKSFHSLTPIQSGVPMASSEPTTPC